MAEDNLVKLKFFIYLFSKSMVQAVDWINIVLSEKGEEFITWLVVIGWLWTKNDTDTQSIVRISDIIGKRTVAEFYIQHIIHVDCYGGKYSILLRETASYKYMYVLSTWINIARFNDITEFPLWRVTSPFSALIHI